MSQELSQQKKDEQEINRIAKKMCEDRMCMSMAEGRRVVREIKARGMFPNKLRQLYEKQGKEWKDEV